jgi:PAS domain-containing protein
MNFDSLEAFDPVYPKRDPANPFSIPTLKFVPDLDSSSMADEASIAPLSPLTASVANESHATLGNVQSPLNDMETDTSALVRSLSQTSLGAIRRSVSGGHPLFETPTLGREDSAPFRLNFQDSILASSSSSSASNQWTDSISSFSSALPDFGVPPPLVPVSPRRDTSNSFVMSDSTTYSGSKGTTATPTIVKLEPAEKPLATTSGNPVPYLSSQSSSVFPKTNINYSLYAVGSIKSESSSFDSTTPKKRQRRKGPLDKEALAIRRAKHNQVEIRRRQRIAKSFSELKDLTACDDTNKGVILQAAIDKLKHLESQLATVQKSQSSVLPSTQASPAPTNVTSTSTTATSAAQEEFYSNMFLNSGVSLLLLSLSGFIIDCNHSFSQLVGKNREALRGQTATPFATTTKPSRAATPAAADKLNSNTVGVNQLLRSEQDVRMFFQAVNQLLRKEISHSDVIRNVVRQDGSNRDIAVKSMLWLVSEQRASPPYLKCVFTPVDSPNASTFGRDSIKQRVDVDSALMRPVPVGAY